MATIKEVTALLAQVDNLDSPVWADLAQDDRTGIQAAIKKRQKELEKEATEDARLEAMLCYEKALYENGVELIAGIDEVGRGPLAGPVVAAAVILPKGCKIRSGLLPALAPSHSSSSIPIQPLSRFRSFGIGSPAIAASSPSEKPARRCACSSNWLSLDGGESKGVSGCMTVTF